MASLGEALQTARAKRGLSLKQVSEQTGFTDSRLSRWERNIVLCPPDALRKLMDLYKAPAVEFFISAGYLNSADLVEYQRVFCGVEKMTTEEITHIQESIDLLVKRKGLS